jgi:hypothetical protein
MANQYGLISVRFSHIPANYRPEFALNRFSNTRLKHLKGKKVSFHERISACCLNFVFFYKSRMDSRCVLPILGHFRVLYI